MVSSSSLRPLIFLSLCCCVNSSLRSSRPFFKLERKSSESAVIYIYRSGVGDSWDQLAFEVQVDLVPLGELRVGEYMAIEVPAGTHGIYVNPGYVGASLRKVRCTVSEGAEHIVELKGSVIQAQTPDHDRWSKVRRHNYIQASDDAQTKLWSGEDKARDQTGVTLKDQPARAIPVLIDAEVEVTGYWAKEPLGKRLGQQLLEAVNKEVTSKGYDVTFSAPRLVLSLSVEASGYDDNLRTTATMNALLGGRVVQQFEVVTPSDTGKVDKVNFGATVARHLVQRFHRSSLVAQLSRTEGSATVNRKKEVFPRALVFDIQDEFKKLRPEMTLALTEYLAVQLMRKAGYRLIPREQLKGRLKLEKAQTYKDCFDSVCQIELGKALAAQKTISTKLLQKGTQCVFTLTVFDLQSEIADKAASKISSCAESSLFDAIDRLAEELSTQ